MRDASAKFGPTFVGVVQIPTDTPDADILTLDAIGLRSVRFNLDRGGSDRNHRPRSRRPARP